MPTKKKTAARRKPAAKKAAVVKKTEAPRSLGSYSLEELIAWRNSARKRIHEKKNEFHVIQKEDQILLRKLVKINKKIESDAAWEKKLNRVISRKVF